MKPKKIIYINSDSQMGYKLDGLSELIDKNVLLEEVIEKYNHCYNKYFPIFLDKRGYNPLLLDKLHGNNNDPSDAFYELSYFFYNLLYLENEVLFNSGTKIIFNTPLSKPLMDSYIYFFKQNKIHYNFAFRERTRLKNILVIFKNKALEFKLLARYFLGHLNSEFSNETKQNKSNKLLLYIPNIQMDIQDYLSFKYNEIINNKDTNEYSLLYFGFKNHKSLKVDGTDIQIFSVLRTKLTILDYLNSIFLALKNRYLKLKLKSTCDDVYEIYFLLNIDLHRISGILYQKKVERFFENFKGNIVLNRRAIINKGHAISNFYAKLNNNQVIASPMRFMSSSRLSNFIPDVLKTNFSQYLPDLIHSNDHLSHTVIRSQLVNQKNIKISYSQSGALIQKSINYLKNPKVIVVITQSYQDNLEYLIYESVKMFSSQDCLIYFKIHPAFKILESTKDKYKFITNVIFVDSIDEDLEVYLCLTVYSSEALNYIKRGVPVFWINYLSLNYLFLHDLQTQVGVIINSRRDFLITSNKIINEFEYYSDLKTKSLAFAYNMSLHNNYNSISDLIKF